MELKCWTGQIFQWISPSCIPASISGTTQPLAWEAAVNNCPVCWSRQGQTTGTHAPGETRSYSAASLLKFQNLVWWDVWRLFDVISCHSGTTPSATCELVFLPAWDELHCSLSVMLPRQTQHLLQVCCVLCACTRLCRLKLHHLCPCSLTVIQHLIYTHSPF